VQRLFIAPDYVELLASAQLGSYDELYSNEIPGEIVDQEIDRTTRRIAVGGQKFYFKRIYKPLGRKSLEPLVRFRLPHHYGWRDMLELGHLRKAGFAVADVAAAGEETRFGVPVASFILTPEVPGAGLAETLAASEDDQRRQLVGQLGEQTAKLHLAGFFTPLRCKDVICSDNNEWVLIDRETRFPGPISFSAKNAVKSLKRTFWRERENAAAWDELALAGYCEGYRDAIKKSWQVSSEELRKICRLPSMN
jgi:tRNA A-37 threonylcarbamoyl transferase component Bud32